MTYSTWTYWRKVQTS